MKTLVLAFLLASIMTLPFSRGISASEEVILSCQLVRNDNRYINTDDQPEFKIVVTSFSENDNSLSGLHNYRGRSCVEILAKLVKNDGFEMKGVSSPDNETAYTLLRKIRS